MRLIDADEVMRDAEYISAFRHGLADMSDLAIVLSGGHTIEAEPVRHGRWKVDEFGHFCSSCGEYALTEDEYGFAQMHYCPNCGAKMDVTDINVGNKEGD